MAQPSRGQWSALDNEHIESISSLANTTGGSTAGYMFKSIEIQHEDFEEKRRGWDLTCNNSEHVIDYKPLQISVTLGWYSLGMLCRVLDEGTIIQHRLLTTHSDDPILALESGHLWRGPL
ncbi:hypothetical protein AG1IA_09213 [Rhizoctonia solani AG-1 IA]|uniref:Uncharacterized protein n=1 Tax=Thanatephorus cucumeris (strain AG1-IA) TaxID=983506 RepID=L8WF01_THACA|nr:hypothetical protein AG1IA_09213 [Rhizoctonia solani AG-1 IA]